MANVVSADQLNSFLEKLDILCEKLKAEDCPTCDMKLKGDKTTCENGHGICRSCKQFVNVCPLCSADYPDNACSPGTAHPPLKRPRQSTENASSANENNSIIGVKCVNSVRGCRAQHAESELAAHELLCPFRQYTCKICHVDVCLQKLQSHCTLNHPSNIIKNSIFKIVHNSEAQNGSRIYYLMVAFNEMFWFWRNNTESLVFFGLQFCGDAERTSEFKYSLEVISVDQKTALKFGGPVLFDTAEMPKYSPSEDFIMIGKKMIGADSKFKVTIKTN